MMRLFIKFFSFILIFQTQKTFPQAPVERFLSPSYMKGASISFMVKDILNDSIVFSYDAGRELIPASVMKLVTTASALELLGEQFRYETTLMYDGSIKDSILEGNLYIRGSGDPTLGSSEIAADRLKIFRDWIKVIKKSGIRTVNGAVISDESVFDTEGVSMKAMREDMGSYYGQGSYGINIFDNRYTLFLQTGSSSAKPEIIKTEPAMPSLLFNNYLVTNASSIDSMYITGFPFANERYLYGTVPSDRAAYQLKGDIPEPSLFLAQYFTEQLAQDSIKVTGFPSCYRILAQNNAWRISGRKFLFSSYSMPMKEIVRITNHTSHNLYADVLLKTIGLKHAGDDKLSSFGKGAVMVKNHWNEKGLDTSPLWMFDGSGLAITDKLSASFLCDLLHYMCTRSAYSDAFLLSLPRAGMEGTVTNIFKGSKLEGYLRLKSGTMSRVRCYAGYYLKDDKMYAIAILVNNFSCTQTQIKTDIERLFLSLF